MALQIAKHRGAAKVIGTSTHAGRRARLGDYGADLALDSADPGWVKAVQEATGGKGVDLIIDVVSGPLANLNMEAAAVRGRIVSVGRLGGASGQFDFNLHALKRISFIGVTFRTRSVQEIRDLNAKMMADLYDAVASAALRMPVDRSFPIDQAAAAFTAAVEINPLADGAWLRLGLLEQERGRLDLAEQAYRKAIKVNPTQAFALNNLAAMLNARAGSQDEALAFAQRAVDVAGNAVFLDTLAQIHRSRGELQKAAEALKLAAARAPNDAPVHYRLGVVLEDLKENAAAVAAYKRALAINGRFADADAARKRLAAIDKTN